MSGLRRAGGPARCCAAPVGACALRVEADDPGGGGPALPDKPEWWSDLGDAIARAADLGIARIELEEQEVPPDVLAEIRRVAATLSEDEEAEIPDEVLRAMQRSLVFHHRGSDGEHKLMLEAQSQGTLTWLATVGPALEALHEGRVLLVDELDASLHPTLTATLVEMFKDETLNRTGAQVVFTTHDTSLLDNSPTQLLDSGEVWLALLGQGPRRLVRRRPRRGPGPGEA